MLKILKKLISYESISPIDAGCIEYISKLLTQAGFNCSVLKSGKREEETTNLYAEYGNRGKNLCFVGHVDVVPSGNLKLWNSNPFEMKLHKDKIYGRGAVDMKGAISAMVKALITHTENSQDRVSILLTSDEESSGKYGTEVMLKWMEGNGKKIDFAIVGEPTSDKEFGDMIKIGRRGSINFKLTVNGKQGHVAYPEKAINPNPILIDILNDINSYKIDDGNEHFPPSNLEITSIDTGNNISNVIPRSTSVKFNVRFNNEYKGHEIVSEINNIILKHTKNFELESKISSEAFLTEITPFTSEFKKIVNEVCQINAIFSTTGGTSDARFVKNYCPLLEFGLLNTTAHHINEHTEIIHLQKLFTVYDCAIKSFHSMN